MDDFKTSLGLSLEEHLVSIQNQIDLRQWRFKDLFYEMQEKGIPFLIIILVLPFCQPLTIPGLSLPFGIALMLAGIALGRNQPIWLPSWILEKKISSRFLHLVINKSLKFIKFLNHLTFKRLNAFCNNPFCLVLHGGFVFFIGFYLAIPFPLPFGNLPAAWALFFLALGLLEEDGLFVILAYLTGIIMVIVIITLFFYLKDGLIAS